MSYSLFACRMCHQKAAKCFLQNERRQIMATIKTLRKTAHASSATFETLTLKAKLRTERVELFQIEHAWFGIIWAADRRKVFKSRFSG
jgi:hypothetical protein